MQKSTVSMDKKINVNQNIDLDVGASSRPILEVVPKLNEILPLVDFMERMN